MFRSQRDLNPTVEIAVGGKSVVKLFEGDRRFDIVVRLPERLRGNPKTIRAIPIPLPPSDETASVTRTAMSAAPPAQMRYVPLSSVASVEAAPGPNQISRKNGKRRIVVTASANATSAPSWRRRSRRLPKK